MIGLIKKALFGKTLRAIEEQESKLLRVSIELNELDNALKLERKKLTFERTSLDQVHELLKEQKEANRKHRNDLICEQAKLNKLEDNLLKDRFQFEHDFKAFNELKQQQEYEHTENVKELLEVEKELIKKMSEYDEKLIKLKQQEELAVLKKKQKDELKVINQKLIEVRGKEVMIDKYGNFKGFKK
jgi:hypothetical protein